MHSYLVYLPTYKLGQENEFQFVCKNHLTYVLYGWKFSWVQIFVDYVEPSYPQKLLN